MKRLKKKTNQIYPSFGQIAKNKNAHTVFERILNQNACWLRFRLGRWFGYAAFTLFAVNALCELKFCSHRMASTTSPLSWVLHELCDRTLHTARGHTVGTESPVNGMYGLVAAEKREKEGSRTSLRSSDADSVLYSGLVPLALPPDMISCAGLCCALENSNWANGQIEAVVSAECERISTATVDSSVLRSVVEVVELKSCWHMMV